MLVYLYGKRFGSNQTFSHINTPTFSTPVILHTYPPMKIEQSVQKRRHIEFWRRGIIEKKAYNKRDFHFLLYLNHNIESIKQMFPKQGLQNI